MYLKNDKITYKGGKYWICSESRSSWVLARGEFREVRVVECVPHILLCVID
jgi:hypothetical protein